MIDDDQFINDDFERIFDMDTVKALCKFISNVLYNLYYMSNSDSESSFTQILNDLKIDLNNFVKEMY